MAPEFVHLHLHTQFSILDGAIKIKELPDYALKLGYKAVAITDHGNLFGSLKFYKALREKGLKPIIGMEAYITKGSRFNKAPKGAEDNYTDNLNHHIVLIAKDDTGLKNLMKLSTIGFIEGFNYKPRIDLEVLEKYSEGLICLTACIKGLPTYYASRGNVEEAKKWLFKLLDIFGRENLYVEIQPHWSLEEQVTANKILIELAQKNDLKLVATLDVHYLRKEDKTAHLILTALQMKKKYKDLLTSPIGQHLQQLELHFASPEEVWKKFENTFEGWEKALLNTLEIADKVADKLEYFEKTDYKMPKYEVPENETLESYFRKLAIEGLKKRIKERGTVKEEKVYWERLNYEMDVISKMGFPGYFLIVQDFIKWAKENGIPVGPGRGCVLPDTPVLLGNGCIKPIKEIEEGDFIISHRGAVLPVVKKYIYEVEEELTEIETESGLMLTLTQDHKILLFRKNEKSTNPSYHHLSWVEASQVQEGDCLVFPTVPSTNEEIIYDLREYIPENSLSQFPRFISFDKNLAFLIAEYLKSGSLKNKKEKLKEFPPEILELFLQKICGEKPQERRLPAEIVLKGKDEYIKVLLFHLFFSESGNISKEFFPNLSENSIETSVEFITPSQSLAYQIQLLLARFGIWASIQKESIEKYRVKVKKEALVNLLFRRNFQGKHAYHRESPSGEIHYDGKYLYLPVKKVRTKKYKGKVYDITVPIDHSYTTWAGAIHNSAGGSLVAYALEITDIDPIKHDLLFERFLNPDRISMPDIDIDFCQDNREKVIKYVKEKYGEENVSQIITFNILKAKSVIRDVARAMGVPYEKADQLAKLIPQGESQGSQLTLEEMVDYSLEELKEKYGNRPDIEDAVLKFRQLIEKDAALKRVVEIGKKLEGLTRHTGFHAAGVVIAPKKLDELIPLYARKEKDKKTKEEKFIVASQYDMADLEEIGLLKMDFLGLKTLTELNLMKQLIKEKYGKEIDFFQLDYYDKNVYKLLQSGRTTGVFQLESRGMQNLLRKFKPDRFEDLIAILALYRPGPLKSGLVDSFVRRKHGKEPITYEFPELEPILKETYGIWAYQEQIMKMAQILAGFTPGEADTLRKGIAKKKKEILEKMKAKFIEGAVERGYPKEKIEKLWESIEKFASYSFNKSHSTAYAYVSYWTAYLKTYYPGEFFAVKLSTEVNEGKFISLIRDAKSFGYELLPPDINRSDINFTIEEKEGKLYIRYGLARIKGVGPEAAKAIKSAKEKYGKFTSLADFIKKVEKRKVNKKVIETLIKAGAFDFLGEPRAELLKQLRSSEKLSVLVGQNTLFGNQQPQEKEETDDFLELLKEERRLLGFYISGHPLDEFSYLLPNFQTTIENLEGEENNVSLLGVIVDLEEKRTRSGYYMAIFNLVDKTGLIECVVFPAVYERVKNLLEEDKVVIIQGDVEYDEENERKVLVVRDVISVEDLEEKAVVKLRFKEELIKKEEFLKKLKRFLLNFANRSTPEGKDSKIPVYLCFEAEDGYYYEIELPKELWIKASPENFKLLQKKLKGSFLLKI
jgi:DNA polymerase III alpha subunit/intein/homing endonuclease